MADLGLTVTGLVSRFGEACTITWPAVGMGRSAIAGTVVQTSIRIRQRSVGVTATGAPIFATIGILGPLERDLAGATIRVGSKTYNVVGVVSKVLEGATYQQQVTLA